jgi:hypothetical protein
MKVSELGETGWRQGPKVAFVSTGNKLLHSIQVGNF